MRQLYYTIQTLLRGRGGNFVKLFSLTLGLLVGILLFSQIAYELTRASTKSRNGWRCCVCKV